MCSFTSQHILWENVLILNDGSFIMIASVPKLMLLIFINYIFFVQIVNSLLL